MIDTILIESDLQSTVHVSGKVAVDLNWISGDRGGGGGRALCGPVTGHEHGAGRTVFWTMLCVLVLGSTSVDVPLIFTQE